MVTLKTDLARIDADSCSVLTTFYRETRQGEEVK